MSTGTPYIGSKISLISKAKIRYEGFLYTIDTDESTVTLAKVQSLGTEDRPVDKKVPAREEVYEYIVFRGTDIDDLHVCEGPKHRPQVPQDPAIVQTGTSSQPGMYPQMQNQMPSQFAPNYNAFSGMGPSFNYPFGFRPQPGMQVPGHPHSSGIPPMSSFPSKDHEKNLISGTPSPPPLSAAPGSGLMHREVQSTERGSDRQKGDKRLSDRGESTQLDKKRDDKPRDRDREKVNSRDRDRERERDRDRDRRNKDGDRDGKRDRYSARDRESGKENDGTRDRDHGKERDYVKERDSKKDRRRDHGREFEDKKDSGRSNEHRPTRDRDVERNQKERSKDQEFDRDERPRRGSGSGGRGRRPTKPGSNRGNSRSGPNAKPKFEEDFDFETANAKFNKEEVEKELLSALKKNLTLKDEEEDVIIENESGKVAVDEDKDEDEQDGLPSPAKYYDPSKSFFDNISCEAMESGGISNTRGNMRRQERERNVETFGPPPRGFRGRGRPFRGRGSRGGRGRGYGRGRGGSYRGHYARNSGSRGWVDYDFDYKNAGIEVPSGRDGHS